MNEMYEKLRETREFVPYIATDDDGKPVAHFFLNEKDYGDRMVSRIDVLIVDPAVRGQGIGKRIMDFAKIETKRLYGHETLTLDVYRSNVAGIRCYEASGFRFNGRTQERVLDWGTEILCDMEVEI